MNPTIDARIRVKHFLRYHQHQLNGKHIMCYGNHRSCILGIGVKAGMDNRQNTDPPRFWTALYEFLQKYKYNWILGYIGFDPTGELRQWKDLPCHPYTYLFRRFCLNSRVLTVPIALKDQVTPYLSQRMYHALLIYLHAFSIRRVWTVQRKRVPT